MERSQAEQLRDRLSAEHPDRATHSFILSEQDGEWKVAKVAVPPASAARTTTTPDREPLHDHGTQIMPGGVSPWAAGGGL
jgi:hypothetical protein